MKHSTGFALCLAVIVLTAMVTAAVALLLNKEQDVVLLEQRTADLKKENAALRARIASITRAEQARAAAAAEPSAQP